MNTDYERVRTKVVPLRKKGSFKLGYFNSAITSGGQPTGKWSPVEVNPRFFNYQAPYDTADYCADSLHFGPPYRDGSPFRLLKLQYTTPYFGVFGKGVYVRSDGLQRYVGGFAPPGNSFFGGTDISNVNTLFAVNSPLFSDLSSFGSEAWSKTRPKLEKAGLGVAIAEIRDLPRMLKTSAKEFHDAWKVLDWATRQKNVAYKVLKPFEMSPKRAADSFLNQQFGWVPFLSDLRKLNDVFQNSRRYIDQISDQNGKWVKRHATLVGEYHPGSSVGAGRLGQSEQVQSDGSYFTPETTETRINSGVGQILDPIIDASYFSTNPTWEVIERVETLVTSVGSFQFYRPEFDKTLAEFNSAWNTVMRHMTIHGVRVSPSNIYKAIPWTWAIDWISDVGAHVAYLDDILVDSVAARYFFVMQHKTITRSVIVTLPFWSGVVALQFDRVIETKQREQGSSPYDFSLSWDSLTPRQLAIAAALGITRARPPKG